MLNRRSGVPNLIRAGVPEASGVPNLIRAGVPEAIAMRISGHKTRSVFERYNIVSERDIHEAARKLETYVAGKTNPTAPLHNKALVDLDWEDLQFTGDGLVVMLRRFKADQEGEGRVKYCRFNNQQCYASAVSHSNRRQKLTPPQVRG